MAKVLLPTVKWAQRSDKLYLTIDVQDCKTPKVDLTNDEGEHHGRLVFRGEGAGASHANEKDVYQLDLTFCHSIDPDGSKVAFSDRNVIVVIQKKGDEGFWPRLLADKHKVSNVQVDWDKWVDDDDDPAEAQDFDLSSLQNLSEFGGAEAAEAEEDSDDDEVPGLEAA